MTARQFANRVRTALEWLEDHADDLPEPTGLTIYGVSRPELVWHDDASYAYWAGLLSRKFGHGVESTTTSYVHTSWPAEGDRPVLRVQRTRPTVYGHRTRTNRPTWGETA